MCVCSKPKNNANINPQWVLWMDGGMSAFIDRHRHIFDNFCEKM